MSANILSHHLSRHAEARMRQRGRRNSDIDLVIRCASEIDNDVYFLSHKDTDREIRRRKSEIQALERLRNLKVVVAGDTVVTCYHSRRKNQRTMLRKGRERM